MPRETSSLPLTASVAAGVVAVLLTAGGRYVGTEEGEALMFGDSEPIDEAVDSALPRVLFINTRGSRTITAQP